MPKLLPVTLGTALVLMASTVFTDARTELEKSSMSWRPEAKSQVGGLALSYGLAKRQAPADALSSSRHLSPPTMPW
jgi:hypothetical protein